MQNEVTMAARIAYAENLPTETMPRIVSVSVAMPSNGITWAHAVTYRAVAGHRAIAIWRNDIGNEGSRAYRDATRAVYLVDDGQTVTPYYVAAWSTVTERTPVSDPHAMFLHPFPVATARDAVPWRYRPTRAYHVHVRHVPALDDWHVDRYGPLTDTSRELFSVPA